MIELFEQYGYKRSGFLSYLDEAKYKEIENKLLCISECGFSRTIKRKNENELCLCIDFDKQKNKFHFQTSYFVGIDWIYEGQAVYVQPKLNKNERQINYLAMLFDALSEPENFEHLEELLHIDFEKPHISIKQEADILSPFLLIQFLQVLRNIVRKGLKKSYYKVKYNLEAKVKGKILINTNLKENVLKNRLTKTTCCYDEFGIDNNENRILKKAFRFAKQAISTYKGLDQEKIQHIINFINPAFETVSENIDIEKIKTFKPNPLFKEYKLGLNIAKLILKRYSYNIHNTEENLYISTPPFWIDMSKLFELYVFSKLKNIFPKHGELKYHLKHKLQELDFLLNHTDENGDNLKMVIDTKYKPYYEDGNIGVDDARQVSGYARIKNIYKILDVDRNSLIDCLIIYSDKSENLEIKKENFKLKEDPNYQKGLSIILCKRQLQG